MPLLTFNTPAAKGASSIVTLDKSALLALPEISGDAYWSVSANIKSAVIHYRSTAGRQTKMLIFNFSASTPTATVAFSNSARDNFVVQKIILMDFDDGELVLDRTELSPGSLTTTSAFDISLGAVVSGYESAILADNPYFFYRFQETSGTSFADSSGNGRTATMPVVGSALLNQTGPVTGGKSIYFDGTRIQSPLTPSPSTLSIEFWFKGTGPGIGEYWLVTHGDVDGVYGNPGYPTHGAQLRYGAFPSPGWYIQASAYDTIAQNYASNVTTPSGYPGVADNNWHHFVFVQNGQMLSFYIDGAEAVTNSPPSFNSLNQSTPWNIGKYLNATQCIGNIAEVAFYTTALSQSRVLAHYNAI